MTITTYQMLTWRRSKTAEFEHFALFSKENWGLVIYDEVHLLPAPIFRVTAALQARRRLGLTATLVREYETWKALLADRMEKWEQTGAQLEALQDQDA